jgi:hypothetical protein
MDNPKIKIIENKILSDNWYTLRKITYEYQKKTTVGKPNRAKPMTAAMAPPSYSTTRKTRR